MILTILRNTQSPSRTNGAIPYPRTLVYRVQLMLKAYYFRYCQELINVYSISLIALMIFVLNTVLCFKNFSINSKE